MKIIQETEDQLVVKQNNVGNILFGIMFALIGLGVNVIAFESVTIIIGGLFFLTGTYIALSSKSAKITLSRLSKSIIIEFLAFRYKKFRNLNFDEIKEIAIEQYIMENMSNTGPRSRWDLNLIIILKNDEEILINAGESANTYIMGVQLQKGLFNTRNTSVEIAEKISTFIGVPFIDRRGKTLKGGLSNFEQRLKTQV